MSDWNEREREQHRLDQMAQAEEDERNNFFALERRQALAVQDAMQEAVHAAFRKADAQCVQCVHGVDMFGHCCVFRHGEPCRLCSKVRSQVAKGE